LTGANGERKLEMLMNYFFGGVLLIIPVLSASFYVYFFASLGALIWWIPLVFLGLIGLGIAFAAPFFIRAERLRKELKKGG